MTNEAGLQYSFDSEDIPVRAKKVGGWSRIDLIGQNGNDGEHYDVVENPSHYRTFPDMEAKDIIKASLTEEEWRGYLKGNVLKYRLRCGFKDDIMIDIDKSHKYRQWLFDMENEA